MVTKDWTDIVVALTAVAALVVSAMSLRVSLRALRISEQQERRKEPRLAPKLLDSYFNKSNRVDRVYSFWLSVGNPTDSDNAIAQIDMHLSYHVDDATLVTVKLPPLNVRDSEHDSRPRLLTPCRIEAHDTVSGWCDFIVKSDLLNGRAIDAYRIVLTDSHHNETAVDPLVVGENPHAV